MAETAETNRKRRFKENNKKKDLDDLVDEFILKRRCLMGRNSDSVSDEYEDSGDEESGSAEIQELQKWAIEYNIAKKHMDGLLKIFRQKLVPSLPKCTKKFLKVNDSVPQTESIKVCNGSPAKFIHCELRESPEEINEPEFHDSCMGFLREGGTKRIEQRDPLASMEISSIQNSDPARQSGNSNHNQVIEIAEPISHAKREVVDDNNLDLDTAILQLQNVKCSSEFEQAVIDHLMVLSNNAAHQGYKLDQIINFLNDKKMVNFSKHNVKLPISSADEFDLFEKQLENNTVLMSDMAAVLKTCMDRNFVVTKSLTAMMKKCLTKDVALQYTAARRSRGPDPSSKKGIFKNTTLCKCMFGTIIAERSLKNLETSEKDLISSMSDVFCNVKSWA